MDNDNQYKDSYWIDFELLSRFMVDTLVSSKVPLEDAKIVADVLIESDKRGIDSHGIGRLKPIYLDRIEIGIIDPVTKIDIIKDDKTTAVIDGNNGMGQVVSKKAMEMAIEKAKEYGMGMVAVRNSNHYGIAGYYVTMATGADMIGITGTNARPSIAPTFGVENMLGTNPLTFGLPTDDEFPFVLDCSTSVTQRGKIEVYGRNDKELPEGWVIGRNGETRTDTKQILKDLTTGEAALTPLGGIGELTGGYKGYGLATVVEILSAALADGAFMKELNGFDENHNAIPYPLGHFFIAIDPGRFMGKEIFKKVASIILAQLRESEKAPGEERIFTAGQKEYEAWLYRKEKGVPVNKPLQKVLTDLRDKFNLDYKFEFEG
ncbi:MAG: Ldh family oxidoreductase [Sphaerochaetaceae bacterium]|jgi:L-2-hydroxycarboxylate dehydrogenase (NAD+)